MDRKLLELLVCPVTKGPLTYDRERQMLISKSAKLAYPIRDGIPVLLQEQATPLSDLPNAPDAEVPAENPPTIHPTEPPAAAQ